MTIKAYLAAVLIAGLAALSPAAAATVTEEAAAAYHTGRVLDAAQMLETAASKTSDVKERWAQVSMLMDICTYSYQYKCIAKNAKLFLDAANDLKQPAITAGPVLFAIAFERYLAGDVEFIRKQSGRDFSLKFANPLQDPALATRFYLLNAAVEQRDGNYDEARKYINRAFASLLRINTDTQSFVVATLLKSTISALAANHDLERANKWLDVSQQFLFANLPLNGFDSTELTLIQSFSQSLRANYTLAGTGYALAQASISKLQIDPVHKEAMLSEATIARAATFAIQGELAEAKRALEQDPIRARRASILKAGVFSSSSELFYAAAEIFFDSLTGSAPDASWQPLLQKVPEWRLGQDAQANASTYRDVALSLLLVRSDREKARQIFNSAISARLRLFENQRSDSIAFPLPNLLDRLIMALGANYWASSKESQSADLLIGSLELLNRTPRYAVSDTLAALVAQDTDDQRRAAHAHHRLVANQEIWEVEQLAALVKRVAERKPFPSKNWQAQKVANDYDRALQRVGRGIKPPETKLPTSQELQSALQHGEAFVGYVSGVRICITRQGIWGEQIFNSSNGRGSDQIRIDLKVLRNALTDQNAPSDEGDSQYPVEAAIRVYNVLFGGFATCLSGVKHIVFLAPSDVAALPLGALVREVPPKMGDGYDLSKARWLIFDYAFSQVTSIRDFLSSRTLSRKPSGDQFVAAIGNPRLSLQMASGKTGASEILLRSGKVGTESLRELSELPETAIELKSILETVGGRATLLMGDSATEERFRSLPLHRYEVIHFATHGLVRGELEGLTEAALVLTPQTMEDNQNDGLLTTSDIANLNLSARLVVLSACNTANFDAAAFNTQLQGFASAFAVAGTPATIASLWSVESTTSMRLMQNLYRNLASTGNLQIAVALQRAMIDTLSTAPARAFRHPRFWSPFILTGDGAAKIEQLRSKAEIPKVAVSIQETGGEIMGAATDNQIVVTSEIGPEINRRHSSLVVGHDLAGKQLWSIEDKEIGAGKIVKVGTDFIVEGYKSAGKKTTTVLRKVTRLGKLEWSIEPKSEYESSMIQAIEGSPNGFWIALTPFLSSEKSSTLELIRFDADGKELSRRTLGGIADSLALGVRPLAAADFGGKIYLAVNIDPRRINPYKNSFGYIDVCTQGSAVSIYELHANTFSTVRQVSVPNLQVSQLLGVQGRLYFAGAVVGTCANDGRRAVLGTISENLSVAKTWEDTNVFDSTLVSVTGTPRGFLAAVQINEPVRFTQRQVDDNGLVRADQIASALEVKHTEQENDTLSEVSLVEMDFKGAQASRRYLGNGLSQYLAGMLPLADGAVVYGSAGFNPWLERIH